MDPSLQADKAPELTVDLSAATHTIRLADTRICRKECITYAHTYALNGILTRDFTRRRHAPATAIHVVILRMDEACRFGPIAIR